MFLYIKTNILRGYGIFKNDFAHTREPANAVRTWHNFFFNCENKSEVSNETKYNLLAFLWTWKFEPNGKLGLLLFIQVYFSGMWQSTLFPPQGHTNLANQHCVHQLIIEHYHCTDTNNKNHIKNELNIF